MLGGWVQAGDEEIQLSVAGMQRVIDLARVLRERHSKPLKQPLRRLTIVHPDPAFLSDLAGVYCLEDLPWVMPQVMTMVAVRLTGGRRPWYGAARVFGHHHFVAMHSLQSYCVLNGGGERY